MAHELDFSLGRAAIAYAGEAPWHKLGSKLSPDAPLEVWQAEAGLAWQALRSQVRYVDQHGGERTANRDVLYRSDTGAALGVVAAGYKEVQPDEVMGFFRDLTTRLGFRMEVAGALRGGARIWALARVHEGAIVRGDDLIRPYVLLSTSYNGSAATVAQLTAVRVVCNNTLTAADNAAGEARVSVWHTSSFDADAVKADLGIVAGTFDGMLARIQSLAARQVSQSDVDRFLVGLLDKPAKPEPDAEPVDVRASRTYQRLLSLFDGGQIGAELASTKGTAWGLVSAVTEYVDHHAGRSDDTRMDSAWFGNGRSLKARAFEQAAELVA